MSSNTTGTPGRLDVFGAALKTRQTSHPSGDALKWDFRTWLVQNYDIKPENLTKKELDLAKKEYKEEYPPDGEGNIKLKTFPFKKYLMAKK